MPACNPDLDCSEQPECDQCRECPPPGLHYCAAYLDGKKWTFLPWEQLKEYDAHLNHDFGNGTVDITVFYPGNRGCNRKVGVHVLPDHKALVAYRKTRKEYVEEYLRPRMSDFMDAWRTTGKPFPSASYYASFDGFNGKYYPGLIDGVDCAATIIGENSNGTVNMIIVYNAGRGGGFVDNVRVLRTIGQRDTFLVERAAYVAAKQPYLDQIEASWESYEPGSPW